MNLPIVIQKDFFIYPFMITPIILDDERDIKAINKALEGDKKIFIAYLKNDNLIEANENNIAKYGVVGNIMRKNELSDGRIKILFQGISRAKIENFSTNEENFFSANIRVIDDIIKNKDEIDAYISILKEKVRILNQLTSAFSNDLIKTIQESEDPVRIVDLICSCLRMRFEEIYTIFKQEELDQRILYLIKEIDKEIKANELEKEIKSKVHSRIDKSNKEYFLKEQLKQIQQELGSENDKDSEVKEYREKLELKKKFISEDAYKEIKKQIDKFQRIHSDSADANMLQSYLDWVLDIPFEISAKKPLNINEVSKQLNKDHYGLDKPKHRIEEYFALKELLNSRKVEEKNSTILCFVGPPGVGKTSLANSIATALKRKLIRIALGGLEDVNELRGHRRTYIGAMPGRIVQGLIEAKEINPVIVLDEIDKISNSYKGDPSAVLLEILDPEQNNKFRDYYLNFNISLQNIVFIATANDIGQIPAPLRDRMEFIFLHSYTPQEKFEIAKKYLIPQEMKKHGLKPSEVSINPSAIHLIIDEYTRESGVRNLRRRFADIFRKVVVEILKNKEESKKYTITPKNLKDYLDKKVFEINEISKEPKVGIVNGLAYTSVGGDVLKIEAIKIKGKGELKLTGQLGEVMKESAQIAFSLVKTLFCTKFLKSNEDEIYKKFDLHLHVPEGATPKDGPSAGITMSVAIASILSEKKVRNDLAMTGEITLSGEVLPIGGLKEKLIAAYNAKIKEVLIPKKNYENDLEEIPAEVKENLKITPVSDIKEVLASALIS